MSLNIVMGIDAGCYGVKAVGPKGEIYFPSHVLPKPMDLMEFDMFKTKNNFEMSIGEETYILGDHAVRIDKKKKRGLDEKSAGTKNNEAAFIRAVGAVCQYIDKYENFDEEQVNIYTTFGSPIIKATIESEVEAIENRLKASGGHEVIFNGHHLNINFREVLVLPEGAAAVLAQDFPQEQVYIVDAGSETINLASMLDGAVIGTETDSLEDGVEHFTRAYKAKAAKYIAGKVKSKASYLQWDEGATLYVCGGYAKEIATAFNEIKENNPYKMDIVRPELMITPKRTKKLDAKFANAVGMYFIAKEAYVTAVKG